MKGKMENVKLIKVCCDTSIEYLNYNGWHFEGVAVYKIGMKKYKCKFIAGEKLSFKCAFLDGGSIPQEKLQREALLTLIYGEVKKFLGRQEMIYYFKEQRRKEREEEERKQREEEEKRIKLGEQITFEKYLKNL